jgi:hypothetical protein
VREGSEGMAAAGESLAVESPERVGGVVRNVRVVAVVIESPAAEDWRGA